MHLLREYLKNCPDTPEDRAVRLAQLSSTFSIAVKRHPQYPNLIMFKYDQINSPMAQPIVQECRGVILDENRDWAPVCWSFNKFFNYEEPCAAEIDWDSAIVLEKVDGSLMQMYFYDGAWHVASSGTPDASGQVFSFPTTFAQLFWKTFAEMGLKLPEPGSGYERCTFAWELTSPFNRVVVAQHETKLTLIGMRDLPRGIESGVHAAPPEWPKVKAFDMQSIDDVVASFKIIDPMDQEGYVVVDKYFNRVKIKHPQYVVLHHLRGNGIPSAKRALQVVLAGESREFLSYWPEWSKLFGQVEERFQTLEAELEAAYQRISADVEAFRAGFMAGGGRLLQPSILQKEFAMHATKTRCSSALFSVRAGKHPTIAACLRAMNPDRLAELLRLQEVDLPGAGQDA